MTLPHTLRRPGAVFYVMLLMLVPTAGLAHEPGTVELVFDPGQPALRAELDLIDLDYLLQINSDGGREVSFGEFRASRDRIIDYAAERLHIEQCALHSAAASAGLRLDDSPSAVIDFPLACSSLDEAPLRLQSRLLAELQDIRTVLVVQTSGGPQSFLMRDGTVSVAISGDDEFAGFRTFLFEGVHHILIGVDHLAFLLLLVLPVAGAGSYRKQLLATAGIVTAFTIAHSITLTLAATGHFNLPARPVEVFIALSVVLVAVRNLLCRPDGSGWAFAYGFGLVHGFGFAGALGELAIADNLRWTELLAFNLGVEAGQLLVISTVLPLLAIIARHPLLGRRLVPLASISVAGIGALWIVERL